MDYFSLIETFYSPNTGYINSFIIKDVRLYNSLSDEMGMKRHNKYGGVLGERILDSLFRIYMEEQ